MYQSGRQELCTSILQIRKSWLACEQYEGAEEMGVKVQRRATSISEISPLAPISNAANKDLIQNTAATLSVEAKHNVVPRMSTSTTS